MPTSLLFIGKSHPYFYSCFFIYMLLCFSFPLMLMIVLISETAEQSIFSPRQGNKGYQLRENIKFHLYINTAPCGDARYVPLFISIMVL